MDDKARKRLSKFLSLVLRHRPEVIGIELDRAGWVDVDTLIERAAAEGGRRFTRAELDEVVATSPKQRFALSDDGRRIRASQGHSVEVELGYEPAEPPAQLFHGTVAEALDGIRATGIDKRSRHHVHLSVDRETATSVGGRRGKPVILVVRAGAMHADGHVFFVSANRVWLTERVPPEYIELPEPASE